MNVTLRGLLALCLLCAAATPAQAQSQAPDRRAVTVNGQGEVGAAPDRARLHMAVELTDPDLKAAQAKANGVVRAYLAQLRSLGVKDEDVSAIGLNIRSDYDFSSGSAGRKFLGYHVTREIEVLVRDLDKIGDCLQRATEAGINNVSDPQLESSHAEELQRQAMAKAAQDAQAKARLLAETLGLKLGAAHTISANASVSRPPGPRPRAMLAAAVASDNEELGFAAGEIHFSASVNAEFDLLVP